jgi:hypothetical protein
MKQEFLLEYVAVDPRGRSYVNSCYATGEGKTLRERANSAMDKASASLGPRWVAIDPLLTLKDHTETERVRLDEQAQYVRNGILCGGAK